MFKTTNQLIYSKPFYKLKIINPFTMDPYNAPNMIAVDIC